MAEKGYVLNDIKAREIGKDKIKEPIALRTLTYDSSESVDKFISLVDGNDKLLGFVRLRFPHSSLRGEFDDKTAIIRELHVYGKAIAIGEESDKTQHKGFGKRLMEEAERQAKVEGKNKMLVISGIGVREYYRKLGYELEGPYMAKKLLWIIFFSGLILLFLIESFIYSLR